MMNNKTLLKYFIFILYLSFFLYAVDPEPDQDKAAKENQRRYWIATCSCRGRFGVCIRNQKAH